MAKIQILSDLKTRGFSPTVVKRCGYKVRDAQHTLRKTGFEVPSLEFPYRDIKGKIITGASRYKLYWTDEDKRKWRKGKPPKYVSIKGESPHLYYSRLLNKEFGTYADVAADPDIGIIITEGEFKTDVGCENDFCVIGIAGVWSWKSNNKKLPVIPDLKEIVWDGREVYLTFDSDLKSNILVREALNQLAKWLTQRGAIVYIAFLPELDEFPNTGLDDFLNVKGAEALEDIIENELQPYNYCEELLKLNNEVGYILDSGLIVEHESGILMTPTRFISAQYRNRFYYVDSAKGMIPKKAAPAWLEFAQRNEYAKLTYRPGEERITHDMCYNRWNGWGTEAIKGNVKPWKALLARIFEGNTDAQAWFEKWLAYPLQHPGAKMSTAVVMASREQGTGKSVLGYVIGKIHGENFSMIGNEELDGTFNPWLENKTFVMGEEITGSDKRSYQNKLKKLITQETSTINIKGLNQFSLPDCANYYFTSNHCNAFYIDNIDRRFFVWQFDDFSDMYERAQWFRDNFIEWYLDDGPANLFHYLLHLDLGNFTAAEPAPMTEAKMNMVMDSKGDLGEWVLELRHRPEELLKLDGKLLTSDIYNREQLYVIAGFNSNKYSYTAFGRAMTDIGNFKKYKVRVSHGHTETLYVVRHDKKWALAKKRSPKKIADHWAEHFPELANNEKKY